MKGSNLTETKPQWWQVSVDLSCPCVGETVCEQCVCLVGGEAWECYLEQVNNDGAIPSQVLMPCLCCNNTIRPTIRLHILCVDRKAKHTHM